MVFTRVPDEPLANQAPGVPFSNQTMAPESVNTPPASPREHTHNSPRWLRALVCLWFLTASLSMLTLVAYASEPGDAPHLVTTWPANAPINHDKSADTLLLFIHPRCPCSSATLAQLARIVAAAPSPPRTIALLSRPRGTQIAAWDRGALTEALNRIPNTIILPDPNGAIARQFGATTSGYCMLFDQQGNATFAGGITPARAHQGDNTGATRLARALRPEAPPIASICSPTFGCPLVLPHAPASACTAEYCGGKP